MKYVHAKNLTMLMLGASMLSGCAVFSSKDDASAQVSASFQGVAQTTAGSMPLPVEIAHDISRIYNGESPINNGEAEEDQFERIVKQSSNHDATKDATKESSQAEEDLAPAEVANPKAKRKPASAKSSKAQVKAGSGSKEDYVVKDGDTLMKISFEKFGNVYRWREILDANKGRLGNYNKLVAGTVLNIRGVEYVVIERNGEPYLIRRNDTLVKISNRIYGTPKEWKALWQNNRQLIHDPNKIYAGFTMYYQPKDTNAVEARTPASKALPARLQPKKK